MTTDQRQALREHLIVLDVAAGETVESMITLLLEANGYTLDNYQTPDGESAEFINLVTSNKISVRSENHEER